MSPEQKKSKKKIVWIALAVLVLLLIGVYNLLLSSAMMISVWLPMAERKSGFDIDASEFSVSLFSKPTVAAKDLNITKEGELKVQLGKLRLEANPFSFLFSNRLEIDNLEIVKFRADLREQTETKTAEKTEKKAVEASVEKTEKSGFPMEIAVKKVSIYDAEFCYMDAAGGRCELSGFSFSAADFMQNASPTVKFSSFIAVDSGSFKIAKTKLEGGLDLRLPAGTMVPDFMKMSFDLDRTAITIDNRSMEIGIAATLNIATKEDIITLSDSKIRIFGAGTRELMKGQADGTFDGKNRSGKVKLSFNTSRSELSDALAAALLDTPVKGLEIDAMLSADVADGMSAVSADGSFNVRAEQMIQGIRSLNSTFALRGAKKGESVSVSRLELSLREGADKLNLDVYLPEEIVFRKTASGVEMERGKVTFRTRELNLPAVAGMIGMEKSVPLKSGALSAQCHVTFGKSADVPYAVDGSISLNNLLTTLGDREASPANLNTAFAVSLNREFLADVAGRLTGTVRGENALSLGYRVRIPGKSGTDLSVSVSDVNMTQQILDAVPFRSLEQFGIRNFQFSGNAGWTKRSAGEQNISASFVLAGLTTRNCAAPLSVQFSTETALDKTGIEFRKFLMSASEKQDPFFDLGLSGRYVYDASSGGRKNDLTFTSNFIDAKKIQDLARCFRPESPAKSSAKSPVVSAGKGSRGKTAVSAQALQEPAPLDLGRYNGSVNFMLAKIRYTDDLQLSVRGPVVIDRNQVRIENLNITANNAPVNLRFRIDTGVADGYPFDGAFSMKDLAIPPLLKAVKDGKDYGVTGTVSSVNLEFDGKGVTVPNLKKNLNGSGAASTKNLSFPAESAKAVEILDLLMIPLAAVPGLTDALSSEAVPASLRTLRTDVTAVLEGRKNVEFERGAMDVSIAKGVVRLKQFQFEGGTLKREAVTGQVDLLNETLNLDALLDLDGLIIPLPVKGTLTNPAPDYKKFLVDFTRANIKNTLSPENIETTIKNVDGIIDLFKKKKR